MNSASWSVQIFNSLLSLQDKAYFVLAIDDILLYGKYRFNGIKLELIDDQKGKLDLDIIVHNDYTIGGVESPITYGQMELY